MSARGELALVLHTHMPYVEGGGAWPPPDADAFVRSPYGFGTWPFGEEWLWEAIATSYVPLLDVLGRAPLTLSLTPVLCDQLEAPGAHERCLRFLDEIRTESHRRDIAAFAGQQPLVDELERSAAEYAAVRTRLAELPDGLLGALGAHASWTSSATHAVLPMLASDALTAVQVQTGIASHRRRFGSWGGGFWLPECGHAGWLSPLLEEAGVRSVCVECNAAFGVGDERHLRPLQTADGPVLWPIDREIISLVWSERGYPAAGRYRNHHALTEHHHRPWRNDGGAYRREQALAQARSDAADFVARVRHRVRDGGVCVCALDTELLGHWWYEGVAWLGAVLDECSRQELALTTLDDALERHQTAAAPPDLGVSSWGEGGDLRTWSGPKVGDLAWLARTAELELLGLGRRPSERALRELLALQSSDWAFLATRELAGDYPRERAAEHLRAMRAAMVGVGDGDGRGAVAAAPAVGELSPTLRNLAPDLSGWE